MAVKGLRGPAATPAGWLQWAGLTDAAADRQAVLLRLKVIPVPAAATVDKLSTAALLEVKVPAGQHGPAWTCLCIGPAYILEDTHVYTHTHSCQHVL